MEVLQNISLDFGRDTHPITVFAKQYDKESRFIRITPLNCGQVYAIESGVTARLQLTKPDGHTVINNATISDGIITAELTAQALAAAGTAVAEIGLYKGAALLSSQVFYIDVKKAAYDESAPASSDEYKSFAEALGKVEEAITSASAAADAANASKQAADSAAEAANEAAEDVNAIVQEHFDLAFFIDEEDYGLNVKILKEGF